MTSAARHLLAALHELEGRNDGLLANLGESGWTEVADLAIRQRVGPLLLSRPSLPLPESVRATLRTRAQFSAMRVLKQQAALRELAGSVAPLGIDLIVLKGMHLATTVYPSAVLREMGDIDVLVREDALPALTSSAGSLGYASPSSGFSSHHLPPVVRDRVVFEFHQHIDSREHGIKAPLNALFQRSVATGLAANIRFLSAEDLLVHLCMHAADGHLMESGLRGLVDVQAVLKHFDRALDWPLVAATAKEWQCERSVGLIFTLCRRHLGVATPLDVSSAIDTEPPSHVVDAALDQIFGTPSATSEATATLARTPGIIGKIRVVLDRLRRPIPESRIRRAVGLIQRHGFWLLQAQLPGQKTIKSRLANRHALADWIRDRPRG